MEISDKEIAEYRSKLKDPVNGVPRKDRKYLFKKLRDCFTGEDAINWLIANVPCKTVEEGAALGKLLMEKGL